MNARKLVGRTSLTEEEVLFFNTFGFIVLRQHLSAEETEVITDELGRARELTYRDYPFDESVESSVRLQGIDLSESVTPLVCSLPEQPSFLAIAEQLFGDDVIGHESSVNLFVGDTRWHADRSGTEVKVDRFGCKFVIYPEFLDGGTGALRVIPGSFLPPFYDALRHTLGISDVSNISKVPGFVCNTEPGDVIIFNLNCWHASVGGRPGRILLDVAYYGSPQTAQHLKEMRFQYTRNRQMKVENEVASNEVPVEPTPDDYLERGVSPLMKRWLVDRPREFGYFDFDTEAYVEELRSRG